MRLHCFFTVNSSVNAAGDVLPAEVSRKRNYVKDFSQHDVISLGGVVVRCSRVESKVRRSSPTE